MSVSDPLLKELKAHIFDLRRHSLALPVDDANGLLEPFCVTLEKIFRKGLIVVAEWLRRWTRNPLGSPRTGSNPVDCANIFFFLCEHGRRPAGGTDGRTDKARP
ncbi:uncharacterized protein ISCGN_021295 [Ixodes scapularis]